VDIQISIDGTKSQFEYNRWPAVWTDVLLTLGRYAMLKYENHNIQLSISHTVSAFTVYHLPEFMMFLQKYDLPNPYLGLLSRPSFYSITVLPGEAKQAIAKRFATFDLPELQPIVNAMFAKDDSDQLDNFIKYVKILDKQRNQSFAETFPELYQLLGERCQTLYQLY
jgi:hypothetical protein